MYSAQHRLGTQKQHPDPCKRNSGYDDFPAGFEAYTLAEFQKAAEEVFKEFIKEQNKIYDKADLIAKANEELHVW